MHKRQASIPWPSPITPQHTAAQTRLEDVQWSGDGHFLCWQESRAGRGQLVCQPENGKIFNLEVEPSVRGRLLFGGGGFSAGRQGVVLAAADGQLYACGYDGKNLTPLGLAGKVSAAPALSPDGQWVAFVSSNGANDSIQLVSSHTNAPARLLSSGADFYLQPVWSPNGRQLAWVEWDHPNMPWDGARLILADLHPDSGEVAAKTCLAGDASHPVQQPCFSPDGRWLCYIDGGQEWERLMLVDLKNDGQRPLLEKDGLALSRPAWLEGMRSMGWSPDGQWVYHIRLEDGFSTLWRTALDGRSEPIQTVPFTHLRQLSVSPIKDAAACIASSPTQPDCILLWSGGACQVVAASQPTILPAGYFSIPRPYHWRSGDGATIHGLYYPPTHPEFELMSLPPTILHVHSGPTRLTEVEYNPEAAYFTSRGYAWLEVNYRGSSGYGRSYQQALNGQWGKMDVEDTISAARALVSDGLADPQRMAVFGGSAGGFTVLNTLAHFPGVFKAGVSRYGVANLFNLVKTPPKLELHYHETLVGPLPAAEDLYRQRSPVFHAGQIRDPLALFQGSDDPVVPPEQAEEMAAALAEHGTACFYRLYSGEGHSFRRTETITDFYQQMEIFLQRYLLEN